MKESEMQDIIIEAVAMEHMLDEKGVTSKEWSEIFNYLDECFDKKSVLEDIKAEIKNLVTNLYDSNYDRLALSAVETCVNEIIDRHISRK